MLQQLCREIKRTVTDHLPTEEGQPLPDIAVETPPNIQLGDLALPVAFTLARRLKKSPRAIAEMLASVLQCLPQIARVEVAGAGYLNLKLRRGRWLADFYRSVLQRQFGILPEASPYPGKVIVEHTNINPNKAAHIGHLRNAVIGDSFVRVLQSLGQEVEVQNYIDNTGVQVADVVVGFQHLSEIPPEEVLAQKAQPFDYFCWDLYARTTRFYEEDAERIKLRQKTLQDIEHGTGETARMAELTATENVRAHLATMFRLGIQYDFLPRESDILHLKFWSWAFQQLKAQGAIQFVENGKNAGCWIMKTEIPAFADESAEDGADEKVIVRSNGTVTYVGKDIAYQLWKFGLLGMDFYYQPFQTYPDGKQIWVSSSEKQDHGHSPSFGKASRVYNVIDQRQSYLQEIVVAGLRALGFSNEADNSIHFSYEMVALSPRCCADLGIELSPEDQTRSYVEVSGRKGLGVKADDLINRLEELAGEEVQGRHASLSGPETGHIAHQIAVSALRYFLLKFTRNSIIAFDFNEALSFEGETGPYLQYSVVRANNIFRKLADQEPDTLEEIRSTVLEENLEDWIWQNDDIWDMVMLGARLPEVLRQALANLELSIVAKWTFTMAQKFNLFYHRHPILSEKDPQKRANLLLVADLFRLQMTRALELLGIEVPDRM